jgi:O-antigen/teichoic acid export membrane protein
MQDRKGRLALNSILSLLSWLAPVGLGLAVTPIIIRYLGTELYGVYLVLLGFISYSITFNVGRTVAKYVAEYRSSGDEIRIRQTISSAFWLNLAAGLFVAMVIALLSEWIVTALLQVSPKFQAAARSALIIGGFAIPAVQVGQVFQNVLQGIHRFGKVSLLLNLNWLLLNAGNVVLVFNGFGIVAIFAWNLSVGIAIAGFSFLVVRRQDPNFVPGNSTGSMLKLVVGYGLSIFLYQLFGTVLLLFERAWILRNFGAAESAFYLLPMTLAIYLHALIGSLTLAIFPVVNELLNDRERLLRLYRQATKIVVAVTALVVGNAIALGQLFLLLWLGRDFADNAFTNLIYHFLTFGLIAIMIIVWHINEAHGAARLNSIQVFLWAAVSIPLMIVSSNIWLAEGVAASRFAGVLVTVPMMLYSESRFLGSIQWRFWGQLIVKVVPATAALIVVERLLLSALTPSWFCFVVSGLSGSAIFVLVLLLTGFVSAEEKELGKRLLLRVGLISNG